MRIVVSSSPRVSGPGRKPVSPPIPKPMGETRLLREGLGFLHIPRTGGSYLSRKLGLGIHDPIFQGGASLWHKIPTGEILSQRKVWFTIIRNPYHRMYSEIRWRKKQDDLSWFEKLKVPADDHFCLQVSLARHVKNWIRYENLPSEFNLLMKSVGYPEVDFSDWRASLAQPLHEFDSLIKEKYAVDFKELGYEK